MSWYSFLLGYTVLHISKDSITDFFELCRVLEITPRGLRRIGKGEDLTCRFTRFSAARLLHLSQEKGLGVRSVRQGGLPALWLRFIRRPGMVIGTGLALALLLVSRLFLWEVSLEGCEAVSEEEIRAELDEIGLRRGAFLPLLDGDDIALSLRQADARVGYVTVNMIGTVAFVQIKEAEPAPVPTPTAPANLVAKKDGVILLPMIFEGECLVEIGERVRRGQLLASGIIDGEQNGFRITRASGEIWARTEEKIIVNVPLSYEEKVYTGKLRREVEVQFFGLCGKVFKNTGNVDAQCDIIINNHILFAGTRTLPFGVSVTEHRAYAYQTATRTATQALALAKAELASRLAAGGEARKLLSTTVETVLDDAGVTLVCTAAFEENIGLISEFSVTDAVKNLT